MNLQVPSVWIYRVSIIWEVVRNAEWSFTSDLLLEFAVEQGPQVTPMHSEVRDIALQGTEESY